MSDTPEAVGKDFIRQFVDEDIARRFNDARIQTRFPPEPNGFLHIGHAQAIWLDFGIATEFGGVCALRFDDTNPEKEDDLFVQAIRDDIRWLGYDWGEREYFASDYFDQLYEWALQLIRQGDAYVDSQSPEEIRRGRGTPTEPGSNSPFRERSVEENLDLFQRMRAGEFADGAHVLRASIDMAHPNLVMRDPTMYRIRRAHHHRTGDLWPIYPMYDWAHGQSDAIERVTHSICTLEFEIHRPLYDWFLERLGFAVDQRPRQLEFARLAISSVVTSKRVLRRVVEEGVVDGWDDPRMPTLRGLRRRGVTPSAIRAFVERAGVTKTNKTVDHALLDFCVREDCNRHALRRMVVLDPVRLVITNYPEGQSEQLEAENNPEDAGAGSRMVSFSRELLVEREDYLEDAPKKWFRLGPGREVRLKHAYYVTVTDAIHNGEGKLVEVHCTYDPHSRGGWTEDGRKVKGTLHWVDARTAIPCEVRDYDRLFSRDDMVNLPDGSDVLDFQNPESLRVRSNARAEASVREIPPETHVQFLRQGYYITDSVDHSADRPVFNRTVGLRDSWKGGK